jgi:hypothetical protein
MRKIFHQFFTIMIVVLLIGCTSLPSSLSTSQTSDRTIYNEELKQNLELWQASKISNYNFVINKMDMGTWSWIPSLIKVRDGQVASKTPITKEPKPMTRIDGYDDFDTVEKSFNKIHEAYGKGYSVQVKYNMNLGYPEKTVIDHMKTTDSSFSIEISKFEVIKDN